MLLYFEAGMGNTTDVGNISKSSKRKNGSK